MKKHLYPILFVALTAALPAQSALIHYYDFDSDVADAVGGADGTLFNGAAVSGGVLHLDGLDDFVQFDTHLVPTSGSYTVAFFAQHLSPQAGLHTEMISQGASLGPGFYIGHDPNGIIRVTDDWQNTGVLLPSDGQQHHYALVVDQDTNGSFLYIDGILHALVGFAISTTNSGSDTRFGRQFGNLAEYFHGTIDEMRIYDNALTDLELNLVAFDLFFRDGFED